MKPIAKHTSLAALFALLAMGGCTVMPTGPQVMVLPGTGKSFDQFRLDDMDCRQYASMQTGSASAAATDSAVRSAAVGTVIGAAAGAAINGREGAATGAGLGLLMGSAAGANAADASAYGSQRHYDNSYVQCMYAKGHRVPSFGHYTSDRYQNDWTPPPPPPGAVLPR
jgi:hypothetical protein